MFALLEILTLETISDKMKILLMGLYKLLSLNKIDFLFHLSNAYDFFCFNSKNITVIVDFNIKPGNGKLNDFCEMNRFEHLILNSTFFKTYSFLQFI